MLKSSRKRNVRKAGFIDFIAQKVPSKITVLRAQEEDSCMLYVKSAQISWYSPIPGKSNSTPLEAKWLLALSLSKAMGGKVS